MKKVLIAFALALVCGGGSLHADPPKEITILNENPVPLPFTDNVPNATTLSTIACQGANCVAASDQNVYTSSVGGTSWTQSYTITGGTWIAGGHFHDLKPGGPDEFVLIGIGGNGSSMYNVWSSLDKGKNWSPQNVAEKDGTSIEFKELAYNNGNGFIAFGNPVGTDTTLYYARRTTAQSDPWVLSKTRQSDVPTGIAWRAPFTCVLVAQNGDIYANLNPVGPCGAEDMSAQLRVTAGESYGIYLRDIHARPAQSDQDAPLYIAVGYRSDRGGIMVSPDRLTWYRANTTFSLVSVACNPGGHCLAVSDTASTGFATVDGYTWREVSLQGSYKDVTWSNGYGTTTAAFVAVGANTTRYTFSNP